MTVGLTVAIDGVRCHTRINSVAFDKQALRIPRHWYRSVVIKEVNIVQRIVMGETGLSTLRYRIVYIAFTSDKSWNCSLLIPSDHYNFKSAFLNPLCVY